MTVDWIGRAITLIGKGQPVAVITVCAVEGSAPREPGAKMIISRDAQWGTIGGGALEHLASMRAGALLKETPGIIRFEEFPLGPALGQCCGGRVVVSYEFLCERDLDWLGKAQTAIACNGKVTLERNIPDGPWRIVEGADGKADAPLSFFAADDTALSERRPVPESIARVREHVRDRRTPVFLFGAGHVGKEIARCLAPLPVTLSWIDRRDGVFPDSAGAMVQYLQTDDETGLVASAPAGACFFVMTHSHQLDFNLVREILKRGDSAYCGLIGSATKRARFRRRLIRAGASDAQIEHLCCPIGADGLNSKLPAVIALSAVHEMLLADQSFRTQSTKKADNDRH